MISTCFDNWNVQELNIVEQLLFVLLITTKIKGAMKRNDIFKTFHQKVHLFAQSFYSVIFAINLRL